MAVYEDSQLQIQNKNIKTSHKLHFQNAMNALIQAAICDPQRASEGWRKQTCLSY